MSKCTDSGKEGGKKCLKYRDDGYEACKEYRDDGYSSCDRWDANCCDWWPCSWACKIISWICAAWIWISNIVCVFAVWISSLVCVLWVVIAAAICVAVDVIVTVLGAIVDTLESIFGWILSAIAFVIEFILSIPIVGRLAGWLLAAYLTGVWFVAGIIDTIAGLIGIRPEKKLRICTIILADENGQSIVSASTVVPWLQEAIDVYKREANVRVMLGEPFHYTTGFDNSETATTDWIHVPTDPSATRILDLGDEAATAAADLTAAGSDYNKIAILNCFYGTWRKVVGYGAPITVFVIRSLQQGVGRSLGPLTDYIVIGGAQIPGPDITDVAHEIGHACNHLGHAGDGTNLMNGNSPRGTSLSWWQVALVRSSRHVSYF